MDLGKDVQQRQRDESNQSRDSDEIGTDGPERSGPSALQGLLRRLGADLMPGPFGTSHSRLQQLRSAISSPSSAGGEQQIDALSELCEFLSVGTEESLISFSVNLFVSPLVNLLQTDSNTEVKIYAARALTHMMDALPSSSSAIANHGASEPLCQNLLSIEYIDLAEQSLSALHKLSVEYPHQIVRANGFQAVLSFIDFFSLSMQRVAAATACNLCRQPQTNAMDMIRGVIPTMMRLMDSDDQRIRESTVLGFMRLAESFRTSASNLEVLCGEGGALIERILLLIVPPSPPSLAPQSYSYVLRLLSILCRGNVTVGLRVLSDKPFIERIESRLSSGSTLYCLDCLALVESLLPHAQEDKEVPVRALPTRPRRRRGSTGSATMASVNKLKREHLEKNSEPLRFFGETLLSTLMKLYVSSADINARNSALSTIWKFICAAPADVLTKIVKEDESGATKLTMHDCTLSFCSFVAGLLGENSTPGEAEVGLEMADSTLRKLPSLREKFLKEGVMHEIARLAGIAVGPDKEDSQKTGERMRKAERHSEPKGQSMIQRLRASRSLEDTTLHAALGNAESPRSDVDSEGEDVNHDESEDLRRATRALMTASRDGRSHIDEDFDPLLPGKAQKFLSDHLRTSPDAPLDEKCFESPALGPLSIIRKSFSEADSPDGEIRAARALSDLVLRLTASGGLTAFEVSKSSLMEGLHEYLSTSDLKLKSSRIACLIDSLNTRSKDGAFSRLVGLGLGVIQSQENLAIQTNQSFASSVSNQVSAGLRQLAQPFKLRLRKCAGNDTEQLRDYSHHIVLIEPLATMASIEDFLWPKVDRPDDEGLVGLSHRRRLGRGREGRASRDRNLHHGTDNGRGTNRETGSMLHKRGSGRDIDTPADAENDHVVEDDDCDGSNGVSDDDASSADDEGDVIEQDFHSSPGREMDASDAFDLDHFSTTLPAFELDHEALGQTPTPRTSRRGESHRHGLQRSAFAHRHASNSSGSFSSYAAALAANVPHSSDRISLLGTRRRASRGFGPGSSTRPVEISAAQTARLNFTLNGKEISHDCSILSAVIGCAAKDREIGSRLWSDVHILEYSTCEGQKPSDSSRGDRASPAGVDNLIHSSANADRNCSVRRSPRFMGNQSKTHGITVERRQSRDGNSNSSFASKVNLTNKVILATARTLTPLPCFMTASIEVLRYLHWMHERSRVHLQKCLPGGLNIVNENSHLHFHSYKLSAKLLRQVSDPIALCGGMIPEWCFTVCRDASFLIPFETRQAMFQSTSLGVARALHLLQTRVDMSGTAISSNHGSRGQDDSEPRIGRIQRQKVRLHRGRLLESAIKVINMYGAHTTVLEVEYFDEAGTGLGPTLEFYTLASREVQRADLALWRSNTSTNGPRENRQNAVHRTASVESGTLPGPNRPAAAVKRRSRRHVASATEVSPSANATGTSFTPEYVVPTGMGLFPSCMTGSKNGTSSLSSKSTPLYSFVGRLLGKAIVDGRLLDLRFSQSFSRLLLAYCRVYHNKAIGRSANASHGSRSRRGRISLPSLTDSCREEVWKLYTDGVSAMELLENVDGQLALSLTKILEMVRDNQPETVESLCLNFVLPGYDEVELVENGAQVDVTLGNADDYVRRVVYHTVFRGVQAQTEALLHGLQEILDVKSLLFFKYDELDLLMCGPAFETWTKDFLVQATRCDHGFSHESAAVRYLLQILSEMDSIEQKQFVLFTTGSPALPLGGLKKLHPRLTIVRRTPENEYSPDECLPTVMTCTNYFKLPDYSSLEIARKQIMYAVREGQGSFHLS